jgi:SAM-dependent methyltransferase
MHFGFNLRRFALSISGIPSYFRDMRIYKRTSSSLPTFDLKIWELLPILYDRRESAGVARGHYFHQDLWAAKKIFQRRPPDHYDIGSRIDGFIAHVLTFMPITVIDIRSLSSEIDGLQFIKDDATELTSFANNSIDSLSCLHAAEHFGLGRYGDQIDPSGCFKLMKSLQRVLRPGGRLYFSVPIGRERVEFNAHRVFAISTVVNSFAEVCFLFLLSTTRGSFIRIQTGRRCRVVSVADCLSLQKALMAVMNIRCSQTTACIDKHTISRQAMRFN